MKIALVNLSKRLDGESLTAMHDAGCVQLLRDFCPVWDRALPLFCVVDNAEGVPADHLPVYIGDKADVDGALGYHDQKKGVPYGKVFVDIILDNGGTLLGDMAHPDIPCVSATLSHEILELVADPWADYWAQGPMTVKGSLIALEVGDPVQDGTYFIDGAATSPVGVSNFVTPQWFDADLVGKAGDFDKMGVLSAPFTKTSGGYLIVSDGVNVSQLTGETMPEWLKAQKLSERSRYAVRKT